MRQRPTAPPNSTPRIIRGTRKKGEVESNNTSEFGNNNQQYRRIEQASNERTAVNVAAAAVACGIDNEPVTSGGLCAFHFLVALDFRKLVPIFRRDGRRLTANKKGLRTLTDKKVQQLGAQLIHIQSVRMCSEDLTSPNTYGVLAAFG